MNNTIFEKNFWNKVELKPEGMITDCWNWQASKEDGYGRFWNGKHIQAHHFSFKLFKGDIPKELQTDHLCRNRGCVNPDHLELVTQRENVLRGISIMAVRAKQTHCKNGHVFTEENTIRTKSGQRRCSICTKIYHKNYGQNHRREILA